jgi:hypothetical protein
MISHVFQILDAGELVYVVSLPQMQVYALLQGGSSAW